MPTLRTVVGKGEFIWLPAIIVHLLGKRTLLLNTTWGSFSKKRRVADRPAVSSFWWTQILLAFAGPPLLWHTCYCSLQRPFAFCRLSVLGRERMVGWDLGGGGWTSVGELLITMLIKVTSAKILNWDESLNKSSSESRWLWVWASHPKKQMKRRKWLLYPRQGERRLRGAHGNHL